MSQVYSYLVSLLPKNPFFRTCLIEGSIETDLEIISMMILSDSLLRLPTTDSSRAVVSYWPNYLHLVLSRNSVSRLTDHARHDLDSVDCTVPLSSIDRSIIL